jgi:hypothetical protein
MPSTPFFSAFGPLLFGSVPRSAIEKLRRHLQFSSLSQLQEAFGSFIPDTLLSCSRKGTNSRNRLFSPKVTFWAFLAQVLSPGCPCREIVRKVQAWSFVGLKSPRGMSPDSSAYCQARRRLPENDLASIHDCLAAKLQRNVLQCEHWLGREVLIVDGSTVSMPDTAPNQAAYPQSSSQKPGCGFPLMKIVAIFSLASGALLHIARGNLRVHETGLFRQLWQQLKAGSVILADRGFCSFFDIACLLGRKIDCVMRLSGPRLINQGTILGPGDRLIQWTRPSQRTKSWPEEDYAALPSTLTLRQLRYFIQIPGWRTQEVIIVTTLLDPLEYPASALAELYFQRWSVELHFREIKTILRLDVLRCLTPEMIHRELWFHLIAYNMVRVLMQEASHVHHVNLLHLSFKGTLDTLRHWADALHAAKSNSRKCKSCLDEMLAIIAKDTLPIRRFRVEPRARKRRPKNFHLLTKPRREMQVIGHRNRPTRKYPKPTLS